MEAEYSRGPETLTLKKRSALLSGRDLKEAELWLPKVSANQLELPNVTPLQTDFVLAIRRRTFRRFQLFSALTVVLATTLGALGVVLHFQREEARRQTAVAARARDGAQSLN